MRCAPHELPHDRNGLEGLPQAGAVGADGPVAMQRLRALHTVHAQRQAAEQELRRCNPRVI